MLNSAKIHGLYAITPDSDNTDQLCKMAEASILGGARVIQYRNKVAQQPLLKSQASAVLAICRKHQVTFIINDHIALCLALDADGVHIGGDDGDIAATKALIGADKILGVSCYGDFARAQMAAQLGADYIAFGACFPSSTKPNAPRAELNLFTRAKTLSVPSVAIGGITLENVSSVVNAGANAVAVIGELFNRDIQDIAPCAQQFSSFFKPLGIFIMTSRNQQLFEKSQKLIPGGVNSPVRAFRSVGGTPVFFKRGLGSKLWDEDGKEYTDYVGSWGPMILGHAHPEVIKTVQEVAENSLSFGAPTARELDMAELVSKIVPSMEQLRLVSSGTEATMSAIRLARGFTGRSKIVKFEGCYHGHADALLVKAGSGLLTFGTPSSAGVPPEVAAHTLTLNYNDIAGVETLFNEIGNEIACVIVEPVAGNMNLIVPSKGFLEALRAQCTKHGAVLIFDEVMTGFRVALGGAQALYNIKPDLTTLGKIIGGGLPVGAFGGRADIMQCLAPVGPVYQAGTLSGNPVAVAAGMKTLALIQAPGFHEKLTASAKRLVDGLSNAAKEAGVAFSAQSVGGMFGVYFSEKAPSSFEEVMKSDKDAFNHFFHAMLDQGFYLAPSAFEAGFISAAHSDADIDATIAAAKKVFVEMKTAK